MRGGALSRGPCNGSTFGTDGKVVPRFDTSARTLIRHVALARNVNARRIQSHFAMRFKGRVYECAIARVTPVALGLSLVLGGGLMAVAVGTGSYPWLAWIGLLPLFASIRVASPRRVLERCSNG